MARLILANDRHRPSAAETPDESSGEKKRPNERCTGGKRPRRKVRYGKGRLFIMLFYSFQNATR